jgi:hypothetical protein
MASDAMILHVDMLLLVSSDQNHRFWSTYEEHILLLLPRSLNAIQTQADINRTPSSSIVIWRIYRRVKSGPEILEHVPCLH